MATRRKTRTKAKPRTKAADAPPAVAVAVAGESDDTIGPHSTRSHVARSLRAQGHTLTEIAHYLDVTPEHARDLVLAAYESAAWEPEPEDVARRLELSRLDSLGRVAYRLAMNGDLAATKTYLALSERRAKLTGLDAPVRTETRSTVTIDGDAARAELLAKLGPAPDDAPSDGDTDADADAD